MNSTTNGPTISFWATRQVDRFNEPMRTRVNFYLEKVAKTKKESEEITREDLDMCIGRAYSDGQRDKEEIASYAVNTDAKTKPLEEVIDALQGRAE